MSFISTTAPAKSTEKPLNVMMTDKGLKFGKVTQHPKLVVSIPHLHRLHVSGRQGQSTGGWGRRQGLSYWLAILPQVLKLPYLNDGLK